MCARVEQDHHHKFLDVYVNIANYFLAHKPEKYPFK